MPHVGKPNPVQAQKLCDDLAELLGIPDPVAYPGTDRWAVPQEARRCRRTGVSVLTVA